METHPVLTRSQPVHPALPTPGISSCHRRPRFHIPVTPLKRSKSNHPNVLRAPSRLPFFSASKKLFGFSLSKSFCPLNIFSSPFVCYDGSILRRKEGHSLGKGRGLDCGGSSGSPCAIMEQDQIRHLPFPNVRLIWGGIGCRPVLPRQITVFPAYGVRTIRLNHFCTEGETE
ncbi:hypothetical protein C8P63_10860 [Melghirimyces profundicolus]|uniref:Uncharacterized protein n=1 Tax=Melghirimyces profundicolus TaxID=1242148 RepID=A0A2T6BXF0_9BACL|nr:hypothetical protein C8P63_10860 [Melghirimyces profundicolus]